MGAPGAWNTGVLGLSRINGNSRWTLEVYAEGGSEYGMLGATNEKVFPC